MALTDPGEALKAVNGFLQTLREIRNPREAWEGAFTDPREEPPPDVVFATYFEYERWLKETVIGLQPLIEDIAREVDPGRGQDAYSFAADSDLGWDLAEERALRLVGILKNAPRRVRILGPQGPVLAARGLHRWVWNAAVDLWDNRHYKQAVSEAWNAVELQTQLKLERPDLNGRDLYSQAFNTTTGRLRFAHIEQTTDDGNTIPDWVSAHQGAMHFGMGCAQGIRNLQTHTTKELNEEEALEYLACLSVLARWVNTARVVSDSDA